MWCGNRVYILCFIITHFIIIHLSYIIVIIIFNLKLGLVRVCTHAFSFPSSAWPPSHTLRRPAPTGAAMSDGHFSAESDFRKLGGGGGGGVTLRRVQISRFEIDATLIDSFALRRASSHGDSCTSPVVVVVVIGLLASTCCQRPAAKRHFSRRVWPLLLYSKS